MKLLIVTQAIDMEDSVLGFFHGWVQQISKEFEAVNVICLKKGVHNLPSNVKVYSLGKEEGLSKFTYVYRFFKYIVLLQKEYDRVFVHMNQEYIALGGIFWKILGKKVFFWRNHVYGNMATRYACFFSTKVFYTSPQSFTARYSHAVKMPVGIDTQAIMESVVRNENHFLVISRITPNKKIDHIVNSFLEARKQKSGIELYIYGAPLPETVNYEKQIRTIIKEENGVHMMGPINHDQTPHLYRGAAFFINMTGAGSFDKTLLEAFACGAIVITNNPVLKELVPSDLFIDKDKDGALTESLVKATFLSTENRNHIRAREMIYVTREHSLEKTISSLVLQIKS